MPFPGTVIFENAANRAASGKGLDRVSLVVDQEDLQNSGPGSTGHCTHVCRHAALCGVTSMARPLAEDVTSL